MTTSLDSREPEEELLADFAKLWADAADLWDQHENAPAFHGYVSADYRSVYENLAKLQGKVLTVLEWGSGLGVVTIMASRMGFEAYGIESEPILVEHSLELAEVYAPNSRFAQGSFIPDGFEWDPANGDEAVRTVVDSAAAYDDLGMELRDFDLVYAYPWPDELTLYHNIMREFARPEAQLMTYDVREGMSLVSFNNR